MQVKHSNTKKPNVFFISYSATAVRFNPFDPKTLGVSGGQNFAIAGKGCQCVISPILSDISQHTQIPQVSFDTSKAVLDCAWSESSPNILTSGISNGDILVWDIISSKQIPIATLKKHQSECSSLDWNIHKTNMLLSGSWDGSVSLWDMQTLKLIDCLPGVHRSAIQQATWSPIQPSIFATAGSDSFLKILDFRTKLDDTVVLGQQKCIADGTVLCVDWNKYQPYTIASSTSDSAIRLWDLRKLNPNEPMALLTLLEHLSPARKIRWNPFHQNLLASGSYDMSVRVWDVQKQTTAIHVYKHHTEFVTGLDWSLFHDKLLASTSLDKRVVLWDAF